MEIITLKLDGELQERLQNFHKRLTISKTNILRLALDDYLNVRSVRNDQIQEVKKEENF